MHTTSFLKRKMITVSEEGMRGTEVTEEPVFSDLQWAFYSCQGYLFYEVCQMQYCFLLHHLMIFRKLGLRPLPLLQQVTDTLQSTGLKPTGLPG